MELTKSKLKQIIQEENKLLFEQRPRRGIETNLTPPPGPRPAETEGPSPEDKPAPTEADPYSEPKWDPAAMQKNSAEGALYDDLARWHRAGQSRRFKHTPMSALSGRDIQNIQRRYRDVMNKFQKYWRKQGKEKTREDAHNQAIGHAGRIGGEGSYFAEHHLRFGRRWREADSEPFSNIITGLSGGQKNQLNKWIRKSGYWRKMDPNNPIRQDFEKSAYYKAPKKRRRRRKKDQRIGTWAKPHPSTGRKMMQSQIPENQSHYLKRIIKEEIHNMIQKDSK